MRCERCGAPLEPAVVRVRPIVVLGLLAPTLVVSWVVLGPVVHELLEGMEKGSLLHPSLVAPLGLVLATALAWALRLRRDRCGACPARGGGLLVPVPPAHAVRFLAMPDRRRVLVQGLRIVGAGAATSLGAFGAALARNRGWIPVGRRLFAPVETTAARARPEWAEATVQRSRRLGRTEAMVSDISLGSARLRSLEVARLALDRGITYVDTAPDYVDAGSEDILGRALQGRRNDVFVASKFCHPTGHLPPDTPVPAIIEAVEGSLRRLRTDRIDLLHIHSCDRLERLLAPSFHEAFDRLKEQGKARFLGVSTHTPNLHEIANAAIDSDRFDVLMLAYHHGMGWELDEVIHRAAERDLAVVAMKTLKGAKHENLEAFRDETTSYTQAAFRWVLSNPEVSCLVISMSEPRQVDEYLHASGTALEAADRDVLARYDAAIAGEYCRPHCGACLDTCPVALPINDVLRYRMYHDDYRDPVEARRLYAALGGHDASHCLGCPAPCAGACPHGISIQARMLETHRVLA